MEQLLVNLKLLGWRDDDLTHLPDYCRRGRARRGRSDPRQLPVVGRDAFRTATGVHAAAVVKAQEARPGLARGPRLLRRAGELGRATQEIEIGPMSGSSNVVWYLAERALPGTPEVIRAVLAAAKVSNRVLTEQDVLDAIARAQAPAEV